MNTKQAKRRLAVHILFWPTIVFVSWFEPRFGLCAVLTIIGWQATRMEMIRLQLLEHEKGEWLESGKQCKCTHRRWQHEKDGECNHPVCSCTTFVPEDIGL